MSVSVKDRIALLLSIKEEGRKVNFDHIYEKVGRDIKFLEKREIDKKEIIDALDELKKEGIIRKVNDEYEPFPEIDKYVRENLLKFENLLNRSYILVWKAKHYYPVVSEHILPYLQERPVSCVKVFSGKEDPITTIEPIFVRYSKYKPKPQFIIINDKGKLMQYVHDHCIDFIPYVHKLNSNEPDFFVLDLDAGKELLSLENGYNFLKYVAKELYEFLEENEIKPMLKFSGSRGFQVWASFDNSKITTQDKFAKYREIAIKMQAIFEKKLRANLEFIKKEFKEIANLQQFTTSQVAHKEEREDKILIDWSSMKYQGDVRAPFSIHYKTGLSSVILNKDELQVFTIKDAEPFKIINDINNGKNYPKLENSDPSKLIKLIS
jgi:DNA primase